MQVIKSAAYSLLASCLILFAPAPVRSGSLRTSESDSIPSASPAAYAIRFYQNYLSDLRYGHCRFEPTCSQYALEAIDECGFIKGSALAADRLMRCHSGARRLYAVNPRGRLLDSPKGSELPCGRPRIPEWLLPTMNDTIPLIGFPTRISGSPDSADALLRVFRYDASFADDLAARGDCSRAETEYERIAFYGRSSSLRYWAAMMAGRCYFRADTWNEGTIRFKQAAGEASTREEKSLASLMVALARFNAGDYGESERILRSFVSDTLGANRVNILRAVCMMARGAWEESAEEFSHIAEESSDSLCRQRMFLFARDARGGFELPRRNPLAAAVLSAVVPGAGQCYAGRPSDGLRHFVFDGLLIFSVVQLFRNEQYAPGYLLGGFTLPFYAGNVVGAKRSAERYNACERLEYVARSLAGSNAVTARK